MTPETEQKLLEDVAVIKEKVSNLVDTVIEVKKENKKNTKFRIMITGFIVISGPIVGVLLKFVG